MVQHSTPLAAPRRVSAAPLAQLARLAGLLSRPGFFLYLTGGLMLLGLLLGQRLSERAGMDQLAALATERLELYAANLSAELGRHAYLPALLASDAGVQALLDSPTDAERRRQAGQNLARVNVRAGTNEIFVVDAQGQLLAASRPLQPPARVHEALAQDLRQFFVADADTGSIDFYLLHPLRRQQRTVGAVVLKLNLAPLEATWVDLGLRSQRERILVADDQGVVIMSSVQAWKYAVLDRADGERRRALQASGRYPREVGPDLGLEPQLDSSSQLVEMPAPATGSLLAQERQLRPLGLRLLALSDLSEVRRQARLAGWGGAAFGASIGLLALYLASRRRALRQLFQAKSELQGAHAQLERIVDSRTAELRQANDALKVQIAQRLQTEGELLQTSKLAVLGQMSAGLSHEVNQPLTALRALARNSQRLLEAGRTQAVADNLQSMDEMVERMGQITRQLKSFARKAEQIGSAVCLLDSVRNAQLLLDHRARTLDVQYVIEVDAGLRVLAEANRLEQVLVNLFGNAIDAMQQEPLRRLRVRALPLDEHRRVLVQVQDSGTGLSEALLPRLFEPFFTTKPAGEGLGLGLVISSKIIHEFGGSLRACRLEQGMSFEFELAVESWTTEETAHV